MVDMTNFFECYLFQDPRIKDSNNCNTIISMKWHYKSVFMDKINKMFSFRILTLHILRFHSCYFHWKIQLNKTVEKWFEPILVWAYVSQTSNCKLYQVLEERKIKVLVRKRKTGKSLEITTHLFLLGVQVLPSWCRIKTTNKDWLVILALKA